MKVIERYYQRPVPTLHEQCQLSRRRLIPWILAGVLIWGLCLWLIGLLIDAGGGR